MQSDGRQASSPVSDEYKINNVVVTTQLAPSFNLLDVMKKVPGSVYEPGNFPALRLKKYEAGFLIYSSGKIVCTGAKSTKDAEDKVKKLQDEFKRYGVSTLAKPKIYVRNIVASIDLKKELRLHELACLMEESEYNPEYFPGMKVQFGNTRLLVFRTGKAILPGLASVEEIEKTVKWLKARIIATELEIAKQGFKK
jgi:transcription initiation factor TFIID TATA-box-binding protein